MRIKKRSIQEKINPDVVAKQTRDVVDAVKGELKSDDDTAVDFIKGMTGGNVSEDTEDDVASRAIDFGVEEPELGKQVDRNMPKTGGIDYGEKSGGEPDLPFEGTKKKKVVEGRRVVKTIKIRDLKK